MEEVKIEAGQVWENRLYKGLFLHVVSVNAKLSHVEARNNDDWRVLTYSFRGLNIHWMLTDKVFTRVIFKKFPDGDVIAFLLDNEVNSSRVDSYMHVGQHGEASEDFPSSLKGCTVAEYTPLKTELESRGYFLRVVKTPSKYMYKG